MVAKAAPAQTSAGGWVVWVVALALVAGSWYAAVLLSRAWRMNDYVGRFFALIFAIAFGVVICGGAYLSSQGVEGFKNWSRVKLGVDLSGGVILVYELDQLKVAKKELDASDLKATQAALDTYTSDKPALKAKAELDTVLKDRVIILLEGANLTDFANLTTIFTQPGVLPNDARMLKVNQTDKDMVFQLQATIAKGIMDDLVSGLSRRINPGGQKEISVKSIGANQVEIIIPQTDAQELDVIKQNISTAGTLEFRIMANREFPEHRALIAAAEKPDAPDLIVDKSVSPPVNLGRWVDLSPEVEKQERVSLSGDIIREGRTGRLQALVHFDPIIGEITGESLFAPVQKPIRKRGVRRSAFSFAASARTVSPN
ncbi:MAG: hypothetical protein QM811_09925 [Pirellulales bacterium]